MGQVVIDTIYFEEEVSNYPRTQFLLERFAKARHIPIKRYGELFNKRSQNFRLQKLKPALILAKKYKRHVLPTPEGFGIGGVRNFYFAHMNNCLYDCRYCFLQGMYSSANYVLFVNYEDFDRALSKCIQQHPNDSITFFSGYDCDSLAMENITGFAAHLLPVFKNFKSALLELRTKSVQIKPLESITPIDNCVIAYSLIPKIISQALDHKAPSIDRRLGAMVRLAKLGWKIGLRFDPLIYGINWKMQYKELFDLIFATIPTASIHSVSYGPLRFPKAMFRKIVKFYPEEKLFAGALPEKDGLVAYKPEIEEEMADFCQEMFTNFISDTIVFQCTSEVQAAGRAIL